jgi:hypothetical protein
MSTASSPRPNKAAWIGIVGGWALIAVGVRGVLRDSDATRPADLVKWVGGLLLVHDFVVVPLVLLAGLLVGNLVPKIAVAPIRFALCGSAIVVALGWPLVRRYGARSTNPSLLPLRYGRNVVLLLVIIWAAAAASVLVRVLLRKARRPSSQQPEPPE